MADKYIIRVTAGSDYDVNKHVEVPVNSPETVRIRSDLMDAEVNIRVQGYTGLPRGSPETSPYFDLEPHRTNDDQYSIAIRFKPRRPGTKMIRGANRRTGDVRSDSYSGTNGTPSAGDEQETEPDTDADAESGEDGGKGISGHDLQFGNDFDRPIRDRLPPGFSYAMNIVKWWIDPGLDGDPYADRPYLYGPALSSFNTVHIGPGEHDAKKGGLVFDEGGDEEGMLTRRGFGAPDGARERKKWALGDAAKATWVWEYGKTYCIDFFNAYLDFKEFAVRLPGYHVPIMKYWDGQGLR
jgi:hypothetical protein